MLQITKFLARSFDLDHLDLFWAIADFDGTSDLITAYTITVLRSESPAGPWDPISPPLVDRYQFRDVTPPTLHKWRKLYYTLQITDRRTGETLEVGPTAQLPEPDLHALEIQRQEDVLFRTHVGRKCWLYPVRTFGPRCNCFDRVTGRRTRSNCLECFDTGFLGGYLTPIACYIQFDPNAKHGQPTPLLGEHQNQNTSARTISYPPIKPKDMLIEAENVRHKVVSVTPTQRLRSVVRQELTLHEVPRGDVEYKLPIQVADLESLEIADERNFTNPQHIDDHHASIDDILAVYAGKPRGSV